MLQEFDNLMKVVFSPSRKFHSNDALAFERDNSIGGNE